MDPAWRDAPLGDLFRYHNLGLPHREYARAELLVIMCMDNRKTLRIPDNFAFVLRAGGANIRRAEFKVSLAVGIGDVRSVAVIGHSDCRMVDLYARRDEFVEGMVRNAAWERPMAEAEFDRYAREFSIPDAVNFTRSEAERLQSRYPGVRVAPLYYTVEDNLLHLITE